MRKGFTTKKWITKINHLFVQLISLENNLKFQNKFDNFLQKIGHDPLVWRISDRVPNLAIKPYMTQIKIQRK